MVSVSFSWRSVFCVVNLLKWYITLNTTISHFHRYFGSWSSWALERHERRLKYQQYSEQRITKLVSSSYLPFCEEGTKDSVLPFYNYLSAKGMHNENIAFHPSCMHNENIAFHLSRMHNENIAFHPSRMHNENIAFHPSRMHNENIAFHPSWTAPSYSALFVQLILIIIRPAYVKLWFLFDRHSVHGDYVTASGVK